MRRPPRRAPRRWLLALLATAATAAPPARPPAPDTVRVRLDTAEGPIVLALAMKAAPITAGNFLRYVETGKLDGTFFYRAARNGRDPRFGLVQGGIDHDLKRSFFPIRHEPTSVTGLRHVDGTVSMARNEVGSAMGDFFITLGAAPGLDARGDYPGYAAFGHVVAGMAVARRILAKPTWPGGLSIETKGQTIRQPVRINSARRIG